MITSQRSPRMALFDIPDRFQALHVATIPNNRLADEPTPANVLNTIPFDTSLTNISTDYITPQAPSPDELVIRQRGRRRFTLSWSPEKAPTLSPFQKTPTKYLATQMTLRSSPRKRLAMAIEPHFSSPSKLNKGAQNSPRNTTSTISADESTFWTGTPVAKKLCLETKPLAQISNDTPLSTLLKGLSQDQLIDIINNLVKSDNKLEKKVRSNLPIPDVGSMEEELMHIKRNIFKSLPTSRLVKKTDSTAYARAVTHLAAFKKTIISRTKILHDSTHWDALLDYVTIAWNYVRATPIWDNISHNTVRRQCFKILSCHCISSVKYGGQHLGIERLQNLERNLKEWSKDYEDVILCTKTLNKTLIKYRASL